MEVAWQKTACPERLLCKGLDFSLCCFVRRGASLLFAHYVNRCISEITNQTLLIFIETGHMPLKWIKAFNFISICQRY